VAQALKEINYKGFVSAEAFPYPNSKDAATQTIQSFTYYFKQ
jgi:hydroxypyruvate isomerase